MEVKRQLDVLDRRLAQTEYLAGSDYTIADMAVWPWYGALAKGLLYGVGEFPQVHEYTNVQRWTDAIAQRPAAQGGALCSRIVTFYQPKVRRQRSRLTRRLVVADLSNIVKFLFQGKRVAVLTSRATRSRPSVSKRRRR